MSKNPQIGDFGRLVTSGEKPYIARNTLGDIIARNIYALRTLAPQIRLLQYIIMPDHVHFLPQVTDYLERPLGSYIGMIKVKIGQAYRIAKHLESSPPIFDDDFYDRIIYPDCSLDDVYNYIRDNPRRLAVRRKHPDYFTRINHFNCSGLEWECYGNPQLLLNPFKSQVVVHRADSYATRQANHDRWIHLAANGGVLVSPFISKDEKAIRAEADACNGKIILITNEALPPQFRPAKQDFERCEAGRLLIIAPKTSIPFGRASSVFLNEVAATLATPV